jgi:hypothetical protein
VNKRKQRMLVPVRCNHCRRTYDLCDGEPIARYADCTVFKAPCCGRTVDDRKPPWKSSADFTEITSRGGPSGLKVLSDGRVINEYGEEYMP